HILGLANHYGTGYPEVVYRKMVALELEHQGIKCLSDIAVPAKWQDKLIGTQATQHLLVEDRILLLVRANMTEPSVFDYLKTRTFLKALGLKIGLVINFGRNILHIHGTAV
ncbi:MAG: GxxExxY protein, partial [Chloroflexota bacterium]